MAAVSRSDRKDMYSWWWDSHISPKNSKWLKGNLTDMDSKVKTMIKLIEVDEDSFARRAEMYYKKRPELMKLVEEFYRAYRALAERYDHATGVIRQAHTTMAEAFPNGPGNPAHGSDPRTPDVQAPVRAFLDFDEMQKGAVGLSSSDILSGKANGNFTSESDSVVSRKGSKQLNGSGKARKGLNFEGTEEKGNEIQKNQNNQVHTKVLSESERLGRSETDIQALKDALAKLEAEKEAGLLECQRTLERLSKLESEFSQAKEDSRGLNERASKAEAEVQGLKEALVRVEAEREASLAQYQQCLDRISNMESHMSHAEEDAGQLIDRAGKAEKEAEVLKEELARLKADKEALLTKYMEALEKIANLENKLLLAEDYASRTSERAESGEKEVETMRGTITRLTEEKKAAVLKYEQCMEKISTLERQIILIQEEAERLRVEVRDGVAKMKESEEQCLLLDRSNKSLQSEVDSLEQKVGAQNQELSEKQKELGRLWTCVQEERMRFTEAESAFQSLQSIHSKVQEELRSVATELQKKVQLLKEFESQKLHLEDEVQKVKDENKSLNDLNLSSAVTINSMQEQILDFKDGNVKLKQELELRLDQRNALQQEIYCLREEVQSLSRRHQHLLRQVESVGFNPESFGSSIKELKEENSDLKVSCQRSNTEIAALVEKLGVMEKLVQKNKLLENSLADLSAELEEARRKVKELEDSCQLLMEEKSLLATEKGTLIIQLRMTTANLEKLSQRNTFLENSLFDVNAELEVLRAKSKSLEDSCTLLNDQNSILLTVKHTLASELDAAHDRLEDLGKRHADLEHKYSSLEEERESTLHRVEELLVCLDTEKQEHSKSNQLSQTRMADFNNQIRLLQEAGDHMRGEFEEELDKAVNAQFEIFILKKCIHDLKENNSSLLRYCERLMEASNLSENLISNLEQENLHQQDEIRVSSGQIQGLRMGMFQLLDALETDAGPAGSSYNSEDQTVINLIQGKLDDIKAALSEAWDENQELVIQKSVLVAVIRQLKQDVADLNAVIYVFRQEIRSRNGDVLLLQKEMQKLLESNEELILKVRDGNQKEAVLLTEVENLQEKLLSLQGAYEDLQKANCKVVEEKRSLMKAFEDLEDEKHNLEDDCSCIAGEVVELDNLSFVFKNVISEKSKEVMELSKTIGRLCSDNDALEQKVGIVERNLEVARTKNVQFELSLKKSENELEEVRVENDQLKDEIGYEKSLLGLKETELLQVESVKVDQEHQILELSENYSQQVKECEELREFIQNLESQILKMQKEHEESEARARVLSSELQKGKDEVKLWETVAGTFFAEIQSSSVREALIKEKFLELIKAYEILEEESYSKCMNVTELRERVGALEGENSEIKARLAADLSAIMALKDSVASLKKDAIWRKNIDNEAKEDVEGSQNSSDHKPGGLSNLHEVQVMIQGVEKAVVELKQHAEEEYSSVRSDLDSALRQIDALKSQSSSCRGSGRLSRLGASHPGEDLKNGFSDGRKVQKMSPDVSEPGEELLMKDIMLDQASDCSSYGRSRKFMGSDDQILELWETIDQSGSIDLTVAKPYRTMPVVHNKYSHLEAVKENKSGRPSSELLVERELGVDEQLTSKRFQNAQKEDNKRKTLERLASDVQKLTNLQITVQDLKEKLEMSENHSSKGKAVECDGVKEQLLETEQTILKLFDYSAKVMKNIEKSSSTSSSMSFDGASIADSSDGGSVRRKKNMEHARRISEKIARLQLEVQKVQFLLMKLDNNKAGKGGTGTRIIERSTRVLLRDYLYGGTRTPRRRKKTHFCGCVQPATKGSD